MKEQIIELIKNNSPEEATEKILKLVVKAGVSGSAILESRPNLQNLQRSDYHKHKQENRFNNAVGCNVLNLWRYGYLAGYAYAIRRLKKHCH